MSTIQDFANRHVLNLKVYEPGKPIEETARELGLDPAKIIKVASNENPLGPSPAAIEAIQQCAAGTHIYPDGAGTELRTLLAEQNGVAINQVIIGNGSNEIIELLCHSFLKPGVSLIAAQHAFVVYKLMATLFGADYIQVPDPGFVHDLDAMAEAITPETRLVFIANPNNPTGTVVGQEEIDRFMARVPEHVVVCFDEAYYEFFDDAPDTIKYVKEGRNVCVLRTFSKIHGLAGLRIGYGLASVALAEVLQKSRQPFNTNLIAQAAALAALKNPEHMHATKRLNDEGLIKLHEAFEEMGLNYIPSKANFVMVEVGDGDRVFGELLKRGVIVRAMSSYQLPSWVRISIGTAEQNEIVLKELKSVLDHLAE